MKGKNLMAKDANGEGCLCSFSAIDGKQHSFSAIDGKQHSFSAIDGKQHSFSAIDGKQHSFSVRGYEMSSCPFANSNSPLIMNAIVYY
jgi:hypothetical protein